MTAWIKILGSVGFTFFISVVLILLLIISTSLEAIHGTPFAQKMFYQTRWFDLLVSFLWINIFCSTIIRFPFKKSQIGFLITHIGILGLLTGALITRLHGIEGDLTITEGQTSGFIKQSGYDLAIQYPNQEEKTWALKKGSNALVLTKARLNAAVPFCPLEQTKMGGALTPLGETPESINFQVVNVVENASIPVAEAPKASVLQTDSQGTVLKVFDKTGQQIASIDLTANLPIPKSILIAKTGFAIKDLTYLPYATVGENNKLVNNPDSKKLNPAVVFELVDRKGQAERKVKFAYFPEFESMHAKDHKSKAEDLIIKFEAPKPTEEEKVQNKVMPDKPKGLAAALKIPSLKGDQVLWVYEGQPLMVDLGKGQVHFFLVPKSFELPFTLTLKQFRKIDYPGTQDAASYESDVVLTDNARKLTMERTISMNRPLEYEGFKVFQASYFNDQDYGKGSIFTVAKNPGIPWIYAGSIIACLGALFQFYGTRAKRNV